MDKLEKYKKALTEIANYINTGCDMDKCDESFKPYCTNQCVTCLIGIAKQALKEEN